MSQQRFIALLVAAVLAISGALYLSTQRNLPRDQRGSAFLPALAARMGTVSEVSVRHGSALPGVTVQKQADGWTVRQRGNYPADLSKVRKLLLALSDAKIIEEKTSNPASFSIIGVEDPALPGAQGTEISITAQDGKHSVFIGKPVGEGNFARRGGEDKSYIVEPAMTVDTEPRSWIDAHLLDVPAATIQGIEVKPAAGPGYSVRRMPPGGGNFVLDGVPAGRKAADSAALAPSPTTYSGLTADDVAAASDVDFSNATVAAVAVADGNVITLTGVAVGDKRWVQVRASKDAALTAKASGRAFEVSVYRYDAIFRPLEQLLLPIPTPAKRDASARKDLPAKAPSHPPKS